MEVGGGRGYPLLLKPEGPNPLLADPALRNDNSACELMLCVTGVTGSGDGARWGVADWEGVIGWLGGLGGIPSRLLDIVICCHTLYWFAAATHSVWVFPLNHRPEQ